MEQHDFARFRAVMAGMSKLYERELDNVLLDAYWLALRDWDLEDFERASGELMRSCKFMPRPADYNELRQKARTLTATEAWFTSGVSQDVRANRAMKIAAQGRYVGHIPLTELPFVQKRFLEIYEELRDTEEARGVLGGLPDWLQLSAQSAGKLVKL